MFEKNSLFNNFINGIKIDLITHMNDIITNKSDINLINASLILIRDYNKIDIFNDKLTILKNHILHNISNDFYIDKQNLDMPKQLSSKSISTIYLREEYDEFKKDINLKSYILFLEKYDKFYYDVNNTSSVLLLYMLSKSTILTLKSLDSKQITTIKEFTDCVILYIGF